MSGGSYNYAYRVVSAMASDMALTSCCADCVDAALRKQFKRHLRSVAEAMKAVEWNDSCDGAENERELILACLKVTPTQWRTGRISELKAELRALEDCQ